MAKKSRSLTTQTSSMIKAAVKDIKEELASEHVEMLRDYIKGVYRLRHSHEQDIKVLQEKIDKIDVVLDKVEKGESDAIKEIKVPARFLSEKTVRLADLDWEE